jgi:hypothetical protein
VQQKLWPKHLHNWSFRQYNLAFETRGILCLWLTYGLLAGVSVADAARQLNQSSAKAFASALASGKSEAFATALAQATGDGSKAAAQAISQAIGGGKGKSEAVASALASSASKGARLGRTTDLFKPHISMKRTVSLVHGSLLQIQALLEM